MVVQLLRSLQRPDIGEGDGKRCGRDVVTDVNEVREEEAKQE